MVDRQLEITSGFISSDAERIYYESTGQGDAVIFCHGLGGNHANWFQQVPLFAQSYQCITWDQRGFGRSTNHGGEVTPALAITDLKRLIDHLGLTSVHLISQSMGGWAAMGFALAYPHFIQSLVLADTLGGMYIEESRQGLAMLLKQAQSQPDAHQILGQHPALGTKFMQHMHISAYLYQQLGSFGEPPSTATMFKVLGDTIYPHDKLKRLTFPILCIVGSEDRLILPAWVRQLAAILPHAQFVEIPEAGHSAYFEDPTTWNSTVLDFLTSIKYT